jgi:pyruvate,water dikinase
LWSRPGHFAIFLGHNDLGIEVRRRIQRTEEEGHHHLYAISAEIRQLIQDAAIPEDLESAIMEAYRQLAERHGKELHLAVRSSALDEDRKTPLLQAFITVRSMFPGTS